MHHYFRGLLLVITSLVPSRSNIISRAAEQYKFAMPVFVDFVISDSSDGKRTACRIHIVDGAGIDLFNHGFYWEAHETWEQLWIKFGRSGREADFLKALIKLAAAGVKARECRPVGVQRHACRARDLFQLVLAMATENQPSIQMGGMNLQSLRDAADTIASNAVNIAGQSDEITSALPLTLLPGDIKSDGVPSE